MTTKRATYTITVRDAQPHNPVPLMPRLRRLLKAMLRGYGIRCVDIRTESVKPTNEQPTIPPDHLEPKANP